ncbi:44104_t:CDS:1, partial [Gigaspora margarita]
YKGLDIDDGIKELLGNDKYRLAWISYEFKKIEEIGRGGFATVYGAEWTSRKIDGGEINSYIVLKKFRENDYLNEIKNYCEIGVINPS